MTLPPLIVAALYTGYKLIYAIITGRVFRETFASFITFEAYMFKDQTCFVGKRSC